MKYILACVSIIVLTVGVLFVTDTQAQQAQACASTKDLLEVARTNSGELPMATWVATGGQVRVTILANPQTRTVTVLVTPASKPEMSCIGGVGEGLSFPEVPAAPKGDKGS